MAPVDPAPKVSRFAWERAVRDAPLAAMAKLLLLTVGTYLHADGSGARPSMETLSKSTGLKERAVRKHMADVLAAGYLERVTRGHRRGDGAAVASTYRACLPFSTGTDVPQDTQPQPAPKPASTGTEPASTGTDVPPNNGFADQEEHSTTAGPCPECHAKAVVVVDRKIATGWTPDRGRAAYLAGVVSKMHGEHVDELAAEAVRLQREAEREVVARCPLCDDFGRIEDDATRTVRPCAHPDVEELVAS